MDLLTTSPPAAADEQQELSARALRACLAAEAALASLRAECLPLQSSLLWLGGEAGSRRNMELAHRSLQLQIDACESFTLCATAAFKQLCDAHFLPSNSKAASAKLLHNGCPYATQSCTTQELEMEYESTSKVCKENVNSKSEMQPREEAPKIFYNPLSYSLRNELDGVPGDDSKRRQMPILRSLSKSRSSTPSESSHKSLKELASSEPQTPAEFYGRPDASSSQTSAQNNNTPNLFAPVRESSVGVSQSFGCEAKVMTRTSFERQLQSLSCSSNIESAEGSGPAALSNLPLNNLSTSDFQLSGSEVAAPARNLQSPHSSSQGLLGGNREVLKGKDGKLSSFSSTTSSSTELNQEAMLTDHPSLVHRQETDRKAVCKKIPLNSVAHLSCMAGRTTAASFCCGSSAEAPPCLSKSAQSYKFLNGPYAALSARFGCIESTGASVGCKSSHDLSSSAAVAVIDTVGVSTTTPNLGGCTQGNTSSNFCTEPATSQLLGSNQFHECKNGPYLHLRKNCRTSSSDLDFGFQSAVDSLDSDKSQASRRSNAYQGNLGGGQKRLDFSSPSPSPSIGFATSRGRQKYDVPGTNLNLLFSQQTASFMNCNAAACELENPGLPKEASALNAECGQHHWGGSAFPQAAAVTYQMWPYALTSDAQPNSTSGPSNVALRSFAATQELPPFTKRVMQESLTAFESEGRTPTVANDLKNWQVVTRLDAEFPDKNFPAHKPLCNTGGKPQIEENESSSNEDKFGSGKWYTIPSDLNQHKGGFGVASFVDIDSEDGTDEEGGDEDGEERDAEPVH